MARRRWAVLAASVISVLVLAGCGGDDPAVPDSSENGPADSSESTVFVGRVDDTDASIGLVVKGGRLAGFVCESDEAFMQLMSVPLAEGSAVLKEAAEGATVGTVNITEEGAVGAVDFGGDRHPFFTEEATGDAGVYRVAGDSGDRGDWAGWIVLNDGTVTGNAKGKPSSGRPWINPDIDP